MNNDKFFFPLLLTGLLTFLFAGCQYQFGTSIGNLKGSFDVTPFENETEYRLLGTELQSALIDALRRQKNVTLTSGKKADMRLFGKIIEVLKIDRERDNLGEVIEAQFKITVQVLVKEQNQNEKRFQLSNWDFRNTSGTFRTDQGGDEATAIDAAVQDTAEAVLQRLSGGW